MCISNTLNQINNQQISSTYTSSYGGFMYSHCNSLAWRQYRPKSTHLEHLQQINPPRISSFQFEKVLSIAYSKYVNNVSVIIIIRYWNITSIEMQYEHLKTLNSKYHEEVSKICVPFRIEHENRLAIFKLFSVIE